MIRSQQNFQTAGCSILGDGFSEGEAVATTISPTVTDGVSAVPARLRVTVRRAFSPPQLLGPIPDQVDLLS